MTSSIYEPSRRQSNVSEMERIITMVAGGTLLGFGLTRRSWFSIPMILGGGFLIFRGLTGRSSAFRILNIQLESRGEGGIRVERSVTIQRPAQELYQYWHSFENLPTFMEHLDSVKTFEDGRSHWVAKAPLGARVEWDAQIVDERPGELIAWQSLPESQIQNVGLVRFQTAPGGRGTELIVMLEYRPPAGSAGAMLAKLMGEEPDVQIREDLRRFKELMEAGEIASTRGQASGRAEAEEGMEP